MKKIIRLTESDITRIVKRVISEQKLDSALRNAGFRRTQPNGSDESRLVDGIVRKYGLVNPVIYNYGNESRVLTSDNGKNFFLNTRAGWTGTQAGPFDDNTFLSKLSDSRTGVRKRKR